MKKDNDAMLEELYRLTYSFMVINRVDCNETIYQRDWATENTLLEFIENLFDVVEENLPKTIHED